MKLMGPGSCVGEGRRWSSILIHFEGAPGGKVDIRRTGRRKVNLSREGWILLSQRGQVNIQGHFEVERRSAELLE